MKANEQVIDYEEFRRAKLSWEASNAGCKAVALVSTSCLHKAMRKKMQSSMKTVCQSLLILKNGQRTPLFQVLHGLSFDSVAC
jgi:hypothetical protein